MKTIYVLQRYVDGKILPIANCKSPVMDKNKNLIKHYLAFPCIYF